MMRWLGKEHRRAVRLGLPVLLGLTGAPTVRATAQTAPPLRRVVEIALEHNPDIRQARLRVDSAHGERRIARALPNPIYTGIPGTPYQYSMALPIDLTPERLFRTRAARHGEDATAFGRSDVIRQVVFTVRQGFYDLLLADAQRAIALEQRDIFQQLLRADSTRLRAGDIPERDLVKSELELARAEATLTRADASVRAARLALQALMGVVVPDTAFTVSGTLAGAPQLTVPLDSLLPLALARRPDLAAAREGVDQSRSLKALATASLFPVPTVSVVYQRDPFQASARPFQTSGLQYAFGVAVPIPLLYWNGGERQRATASLAAAEVAVERTRVQIESDVAVAVGGFRSARVLAERYQAGLLQKSAAALETSRFAYQQGAISLLELLDAIRTWGDTRSEYSSAVHDYWLAAYALTRGTGVEVVRE
ncbi:MAG TPA: TolC family protein [Gemmatimonadales bacterium]|jgi:cobalt-zinc-cadmium efflux system outer membrane protein|nr:TolC family protein [Gemmatimonadales bacterium]